MSDLLDAAGIGDVPTTHDLPALWDGHRVEWAGWRQEPRTTLDFHGSREVCPHCASSATQSINYGVVWAKPSGLLQFPRRHAWNSSKLRDDGDHAVKWLTAYRCPDCRTDEVWDRFSDELWVLDNTDYTDDGSWPC